MAALTDAEISAKVRAERSVVGTSSSWPLGGLLPVDFSQTVSTSLVPTIAGEQADAGAEQFDEDVHSSDSLGEETGLPLA